MSSKVSGMNTLLSVSARTNNPEPGFQLINQRITHSTINDNIWVSLQNAQIQALKTLDQRPAEKFAQQMYETRYADDRTKLLQENRLHSLLPQMRWLPIASCFHLQRISRLSLSVMSQKTNSWR